MSPFFTVHNTKEWQKIEGNSIFGAFLTTFFIKRCRWEKDGTRISFHFTKKFHHVRRNSSTIPCYHFTPFISTLNSMQCNSRKLDLLWMVILRFFCLKKEKSRFSLFPGALLTCKGVGLPHLCRLEHAIKYSATFIIIISVCSRFIRASRRTSVRNVYIFVSYTLHHCMKLHTETSER